MAPPRSNDAGASDALHVLGHVSDAAAVVDSDGRIVFANRAFQAIARSPAEPLDGRPFAEVLPGLIPDSPGESHFQTFYQPVERWFDVRIEPAGDRRIVLLRDITNLKCYQRLFEATTEGILIVNEEGRYVDVNDSYCRILKTTREKLIGAHFSQFIPPDLLQDAARRFENLRKGGTEPVDFPLRAADGSIVELAWTSTSNYLPGLYFCVCRDVTARRHAEQERTLLLKRAEEAAEHSQWVQNELKHSNEELRRANRDLETFAYSASHDLQEPLRNIAIFSQLLERKLGPQLDAESAGFLDGILKGTRRMENLVQDLLAYSRATRPAEGPVPTIDARQTLDRVLLQMESRLRQSGALVTAGDLPQLSIHPVHFEQLLQNLLSNAIKYQNRADRNEPPRVHVSATQQQGWWVISVADNGIGIESRYAQQIFGLFKRLHSRNEYPGSGVGLAICQRIVEQYGGRIWLESSTVGEGSTFSFAIPDRRME